MLMDQIIPIPIPIHSVSDSVSETESEYTNPPSFTLYRPTFESIYMIDSQISLPIPTPLHLPLHLTYSEPEPDSVTILGDHHQQHLQHQQYDQSLAVVSDHDHEYNHFPELIDTSIQTDHSLDTSSYGLGLGLGLGIGIGFGEDYSLCPTAEYEFGIEEEKGLLPLITTHSTGLDYIPDNTAIEAQAFNLSYTAIDQFGSTTTQLSQAEYPVPPETYLEPIPSTGFHQAHDTTPTGVQIDPLVFSPTGFWSPVTSTRQLPSQELQYQYRPYVPGQALAQNQSQVPLYYQDHTPTLAPHYPDYDLDLDLEPQADIEMTREPSFPFTSSIFDRTNHNNGYRQ